MILLNIALILFLQDEKFNFLSDLIDDNIENATYPKEPYVSFLDHIMTTSDFIDYNNNKLDVQTVFIEDYIRGYIIFMKNYYQIIGPLCFLFHLHQFNEEFNFHFFAIRCGSSDSELLTIKISF